MQGGDTHQYHILMAGKALVCWILSFNLICNLIIQWYCIEKQLDADHYGSLKG